MLDYEQGSVTETPGHQIERIDCFKLHFMLSRNVCLRRNITNGNLYLSYDNLPNIAIYYLRKRNQSEVRAMQGSLDYINTEPFNGSLEGIPITAAFNWTQYRKQYLYMFAGRHLCRQQISQTNWFPICDIEDISDLVIDCLNKTKETNKTTTHSTPDITRDLILVIVSVVIVITLILILIVFVVYMRGKDAQNENSINGL